LTGAEPLVRTLLASGVNTCFANPGTSEMHFVAVHDRVPGMRKAAPALARALPFASHVLQPLDHVRADGGRKTVKHSNPQIRRQRRCRTRPAKNRVAEQRSNQRYDHPHEQPQQAAAPGKRENKPQSDHGRRPHARHRAFD
jgi:hypothetical protein